MIAWMLFLKYDKFEISVCKVFSLLFVEFGVIKLSQTFIGVPGVIHDNRQTSASFEMIVSSSCHPNHTKRTIPFSLALRLRRVCSTDSLFDKRSGMQRNLLLNWSNEIKRVRCISRNDTLKPRQETKSSDRTPFFISLNQSIKNFINGSVNDLAEGKPSTNRGHLPKITLWPCSTSTTFFRNKFISESSDLTLTLIMEMKFKAHWFRDKIIRLRSQKR